MKRRGLDMPLLMAQICPMRRVFEHIDFTIVGHMKSLLESDGIACEIRNSSASGLAGEVPFTQVYPELWILDETDEPRACGIIRSYRDRDARTPDHPDWICPNCGESVDGVYGECWNCSTADPGASSPSSTSAAPPALPGETSSLVLPPQERLPVLDALRGFALFGILLVNMWGFKSSILSHHVTENLIPGPWNSIARVALELVASGKFVSIFAFLFGLGLVLQRDRLVAAGAGFTPFLVRRMSLLLVIGVFHGIFLWPGDILATYALFGFLSMGLIKAGPRTLCNLAVLTLMILIAISTALFALLPQGDDAGWREVAAQWINAYRSAGPVEMISLRFQEWLYLSIAGIFSQIPYSLIFFILGIAAGKAGILSKLDRVLPRAVNHLMWAVPAGIALSLLVPATDWKLLPWFTGAPLVLSLGFTVGSVLLALSWLAGAAYIFQRGWFPKLASALSLAGRMSLTNYLLQSVIANLVFMGWGLGFYGRTSVVQGILFSTLIFILQLFFSRWWLLRHKAGPVEMMARSVTDPGV